MSEKILFVLFFAIIVEALIEYVKNFISAMQTKEWRTIIIQISSLIISVAVCCVAQVNLVNIFGFEVNNTFGCVVTGVFASRGSNYVHDLIKKLQNVTNVSGE